MTQIILKSTIDVEYIDHMGNDERIAHAAWVSTKGMQADKGDPGKVKGVLKFLMEKRHGTPFECGALTIRVHAPIKVWREWHRHRVAWSYNEESGRYKQLDPIFWMPPQNRPMIRPDHFKSSSPDFGIATDDQYNKLRLEFRSAYSLCYEAYEQLLEIGIDRGLARDVLGVGIYSACYCTANPRSIMHFLELRTRYDQSKRPSRPLWEIDNAARQLETIFAQHWPLIYELWNTNGRQAP